MPPPSPCDGAVVAEFLAGAREAAGAAPDGVELFAERGHQERLVGEEAVLEVAASVGLRAQSGARQVGAAEIGLRAVHDDALEVDARAEDALHPAPEARIAVEVLPEVGAGLLGVDEADLDAASDEHVKDAQEGHHHPSRPHVDIHVLDVRRAYPEALLGMRDEAADDLVVDFTVGDELVHDDLLAANLPGHEHARHEHGRKALAPPDGVPFGDGHLVLAAVPREVQLGVDAMQPAGELLFREGLRAVRGIQAVGTGAPARVLPDFLGDEIT